MGEQRNHDVHGKTQTEQKQKLLERSWKVIRKLHDYKFLVTKFSRRRFSQKLKLDFIYLFNNELKGF